MALAIEAGFPLATDHNGTNNTTYVVSGITTAGPSMIVAVLVADSATNQIYPVSISGTGGLSSGWTSRQQRPLTGTFANEAGTSIWTNPSSGALSGVSVTATLNATEGTGYGSLLVFSIVDASPTIGLTGGAEDGSGGTATLASTVNPTTSGSLIIGAWASFAVNTALTNQTGTTTDKKVNLAAPISYLIGHASGTGGSVTVGATDSGNYWSTVYLELLNASGFAMPGWTWV
jgi:hypothetical protein